MKITVVDEHHEVFLLWEKMVYLKRLPRGMSLLHVDSHSDLGWVLPAESVYSKDIEGFTRRNLNIGNFILPAVLRGTFNEVIFLGRRFPSPPKIRHKLRYIGSFRGEGVWIRNDLVPNKFTRRLYPDMRPWRYSEIDNLSAIRLSEGVLDIDLDYFCCNYAPQLQVTIDLTKNQRRKLRFQSISRDKFRFPVTYWHVQKNKLTTNTSTRYNDIIYNDSVEWIECAIRYFVEALRMKPLLISICRSERSGFTPSHRIDFIEKTLIRYLANKQGKKIDPCDITSPFTLRAFVEQRDNQIYNVLTDEMIRLNTNTRFIWARVKAGKNFNQIYHDMINAYDVSPVRLKKEIVKFIFRLKDHYFIK